MKYLLDTNVVSEARRPKGNPGVRRWLASVDPSDLFLSVLVVGEIRQGIERLRRRDPSQAILLELWLAQLKSDYAEHVLPVDGAACEAWGRLNAADPLPVVDGLLAATALVHGLTLVTRDTADLARTGVPLLNPFSP